MTPKKFILAAVIVSLLLGVKIVLHIALIQQPVPDRYRPIPNWLEYSAKHFAKSPAAQAQLGNDMKHAKRTLYAEMESGSFLRIGLGNEITVGLAEILKLRLTGFDFSSRLVGDCANPKARVRFSSALRTLVPPRRIFLECKPRAACAALQGNFELSFTDVVRPPDVEMGEILDQIWRVCPASATTASNVSSLPSSKIKKVYLSAE